MRLRNAIPSPMFTAVLFPRLMLIYRICKPAGGFQRIAFELNRPIGFLGDGSSHPSSPMAKKNQSAGLFRKLASYWPSQISVYLSLNLATYRSIYLPTYLSIYQHTNQSMYGSTCQNTKLAIWQRSAVTLFPSIDLSIS